MQISEAVFGPDHPTVAVRMVNLAGTLNALGRIAEALPLQERALRISETVLGPGHPTVAIRLHNLAATLTDQGRADEALPLQRRAARISEAAHGPEHPVVVAIRRGLDKLEQPESAT